MRVSFIQLRGSTVKGSHSYCPVVDERSGVSFLRITGGESMFLNSTAQNGSECVINLAVVRGSNHLISIDHGGFSLVMEGDDIKILVRIDS